MKITANRSIVVALILMMVGFLLTTTHDYRWIGHVVAGVGTLGFLVGAGIGGAALAGRLRRSPSPHRFKLHRKLGMAAGSLAAITFLYGLWVMMSQDEPLLDTIHGWVGLSIAALSFLQIGRILALNKRKFIKISHRWTGYLLAGLISFQAVSGALMTPLLAAPPQAERTSLPQLAPMEYDWKPDGVIGAQEYFASRVLDNGNFEVHYRSDGRDFCVGIKARTTGWVGIGVAPGEGMKNAAMVYGYVSEGKAVVHDSYGTSKYKHQPDTRLGGTEDIITYGGKEENGVTVIEFKSPLATDDRYDIPLVEGIHNVIWAYGPGDSPEMHTTQGFFEVELKLR